MTEAQRLVYLREHGKEVRRKLHKRKLALIEKFNVEIKITEITNDCYVMGRLVACVGNQYARRELWEYSLKAVFHTLLAVDTDEGDAD